MNTDTLTFLSKVLLQQILKGHKHLRLKQMYANVVLRIWDQNRSRRLGNLTKVKHSTEYEITVKCIHKTVILRPCTPTKSFEPSAVYCWIGKLSLVTKLQFASGAFFGSECIQLPYIIFFVVALTTNATYHCNIFVCQMVLTHPFIFNNLFHI